MSLPLAVDLFCGLGGWTDGLLAEGYSVVGFDIERHEYWVPEDNTGPRGASKETRPVPKRGWTQGCAISQGMEGVGQRPRTKLLKYPAQLVLQDVLTLHGSQFRDAALIVASPPCQEYSYMAMPWTRAKAKAAAIRADETGAELARLNALFNACFRIQREACEAAGRHIPLVVENVRGAQPWVGRARWNYGSFYLWGDVPALMPIITKRPTKVPGMGAGWRPPGHPDHVPGLAFNPDGRLEPRQINKAWRDKHYDEAPKMDTDGVKQGGNWFHDSSPGTLRSFTGTKQPGKGDARFQDGAARHGSKSNARKAASARIAKIPLALARHVAAAWRPTAAPSPSALG